MKKIIATSIATLALLTGCATHTVNIDPKKNSEALQVARAATMWELRDQEIPQTEFDRLADSTAYNAAWATTMYFNPAAGFSSGSSLLLSLPSLLFSNKPKDSFNHVLAWMPEELAESPQEATAKISEILLDALTKTAEKLDQNIIEKNNFNSKGRQVTYIAIEDENLKCTNKKGFYCGYSNRINPPKLRAAPHVLKKYSEQPVYYFPLRKEHSLMVFNRDKGLQNQDQLTFLTAYSENLPDWVYLYIAPKTIYNSEGEQIAYPFMLHQGKTLLFVKPERNKS